MSHSVPVRPTAPEGSPSITQQRDYYRRLILWINRPYSRYATFPNNSRLIDYIDAYDLAVAVSKTPFTAIYEPLHRERAIIATNTSPASNQRRAPEDDHIPPVEATLVHSLTDSAEATPALLLQHLEAASPYYALRHPSILTSVEHTLKLEYEAVCIRFTSPPSRDRFFFYLTLTVRRRLETLRTITSLIEAPDIDELTPGVIRPYYTDLSDDDSRCGSEEE
jgi:hypothetical protein